MTNHDQRDADTTPANPTTGIGRVDPHPSAPTSLIHPIAHDRGIGDSEPARETPAKSGNRDAGAAPAAGPRICGHCRSELRPDARRQARYCSDRCRALARVRRLRGLPEDYRRPAHVPNSVPLELRDHRDPRALEEAAARLRLATPETAKGGR